MSRHRLRTLGMIVSGLALAACGGEPKDEVSRPIELAPAKQEPVPLTDAPVVKSEPQKAPAKREAAPRPAPPPEAAKAPEKQAEVPAPTPAPVAAAPAPAPAPVPTTGTIEAGTSFALKPAAKICTNTHKAGDRFTATLAAPLRGTNGVEVPEGAIAMLRIIEGSGPTRTDSAHLTYDLISIRHNEQTYEVVAHVTQSASIERVNSQSRTDAAKKVGAGAVIGAIAGRVLGGNNKSTAVGGAIGAAAGAAAAVADNKVEGCLKGDGTITLALDKPLVVRLAQAP
jgi:hypothetical protein